MTIEERLYEDMKIALKSKDTVTKNTIQLLRANILQAKKDSSAILEEKDIEDIVMREKTKRIDAIAQFQKAKRNDLVEQAEKELMCIEKYLPEVMSDYDVAVVIREIISELNADSKMLGVVIKAAKEEIGNRSDGKTISDIAKQLLNK